MDSSARHKKRRAREGLKNRHNLTSNEEEAEGGRASVERKNRIKETEKERSLRVWTRRMWKGAAEKNIGWD